MLNKGLLRKEMASIWFKFFVGLLILCAMALLIVMTYDFTVNMLDNTSLPEYARQQLEQLKDYDFWVWSQWFGKNLLQTGTVLAVVFGATMVTSEISRKSIHFLLSKPISRQHIYRAKYLVNLLAVYLAAVLATVFLYISATATGHSLDIAKIAVSLVITLVGLSVVFSISALSSVIFDQTLKSLSVSGLAALFLAVPGFFTPIAKFSLYYQIAGVSYFKGNGFPVVEVSVMTLISFTVYLIGKKQFVKRDF